MDIDPDKAKKAAYNAKLVLSTANEIVTTAIPATQKLGPQARAFFEKCGSKVTEAVEQASDKAVKAGDAASEGAKSLAGDMAIARESAKRALDKARTEAQGAREKQERAALLHESRAQTIGASSYTVDARDFEEHYGASAAVGGADGFAAIPGCYAVLTMPLPRVKDLAVYRGVYVGSATRLGDAVHEQLSGSGNKDVGDDFQHNRTMYVLLYPCEEDEMAALRLALITDLQAYKSYNSRELGLPEAEDAEEVIVEAEETDE